MVELADRWQRPVTAEVLVGAERVEVRYGEGLVGAAPRRLMRKWLTCPSTPLVLDGVSLWEVGSGVAIAIDTAMGEPEVPAFVLPDQVLADLRAVI